MPNHTPAADRSHGGPGSSHETADGDSARTRKGDRTTQAPEHGPKGDAHGHHATPDQASKDNQKGLNHGKP